MMIRCRDFVFKEQMTPRKHKIAIDTKTVSSAVLRDISSGRSNWAYLIYPTVHMNTCRRQDPSSY